MKSETGTFFVVFRKLAFFQVVIFLCSFLCGCFSADQIQPSRAEMAKERPIDNPQAEVSIEPFSSKAQDGIKYPEEYGVELIWDVPDSEVDTFVLFSGNTADNLNSEIHISVSELAVVEGNKYRYVVKPVKPGEPFYISISAMYKGEMSSKSAVQRIDTDSPD